MTLTHCGKTIKLKRYEHGWIMFLDGENIGTSSTKSRALAFAKATAELRQHEEICGKPTVDEIFARL